MFALPSKADMCGATRDVRFGPKVEVMSRHFHVRFTPESGHVVIFVSLQSSMFPSEQIHQLRTAGARQRPFMSCPPSEGRGDSIIPDGADGRASDAGDPPERMPLIK